MPNCLHPSKAAQPQQFSTIRSDISQLRCIERCNCQKLLIKRKTVDFALSKARLDNVKYL